MTESEMALNLAKQFLKREMRIFALEAMLSTLAGPDGTPLVWKTPTAQYQRQSEAARVDRVKDLTLAIDEAKGSEGESLIRVIHRFLLEE